VVRLLTIGVARAGTGNDAAEAGMAQARAGRPGLVIVMGIVRTWRRLKVLKAVGQAANQAARDAPGPVRPSRGMTAGFINVIADALAPRLAATAERRGGPLPGGDAAVVDGSAWTQPVGVGTAQLRARDQAFDPTLLESFAGQVFAAVIAVWAGADAGSVRPVMSDGLWEPLAAVTGVRSGRDEFARLSGQRAPARLAGLHAGAWYDSALVIMRVRLDFGGEVPPPGMPPEMTEWDEDWLFQRSVRPGGDPMIRPPACSSCGAPTRVDEHGFCLHCRAPVPYLTAGWLVTGIVSHHPAYAMARKHMVEGLRANPEALQSLSPEVIRLLPPGLSIGGLTGPASGSAP
jgi:hypothetical protein